MGHRRAIPRHEGDALVEFGRQVILDEVEGGIITRYENLEHPAKHGQAKDARIKLKRLYPSFEPQERDACLSNEEEQNLVISGNTMRKKTFRRIG